MTMTSGTASAQGHNELRQVGADLPRLLHCLAVGTSKSICTAVEDCDMGQRLQKRLQRRLMPSGTPSRPLEGYAELALDDGSRSLPDATQRGQQDLDQVFRLFSCFENAVPCRR
eukprot:9776015-Heterocapsa_arctica.AAC.1